MEQQVDDVMLEHLKNLKQAAEECEDDMLQTITNAMCMTAQFLVRKRDSPTDKNTD